MRCLLHHTDAITPPVGIWWEDEAGGDARCFYLPAAGAEKIIGTQIMSQKSDDATWQDYFDFLEDSIPVINGWESADVSEPPDKYLQRVSRFTKTAS